MDLITEKHSLLIMERNWEGGWVDLGYVGKPILFILHTFYKKDEPVFFADYKLHSRNVAFSI